MSILIGSFEKWTFLKCPKLKKDCQTQKSKKRDFSLSPFKEIYFISIANISIALL